MRVWCVVLCVYVHMIRVTASRTWVSILWANLIIPTAVIVLYIPWTPRLLRARVAVWCVCARARVRVLLLLCVCVVTQHIGSARTSSKSNSSTRLCVRGYNTFLQHITVHWQRSRIIKKQLLHKTALQAAFACNHKRTTTSQQPQANNYGISVPYICVHLVCLLPFNNYIYIYKYLRASCCIDHPKHTHTRTFVRAHKRTHTHIHTHTHTHTHTYARTNAHTHTHTHLRES